MLRADDPHTGTDRTMTKLTLLLNSQSSGGNAWFALAEERGYFAEEGVEITLAAGRGGYRAAELAMEGAGDLAFGDLSGLVAMVAAHGDAAPVAVYSAHQNSPAAIAVPSDGPVQVAADLRGKALIGHGGDVGLRIFSAYTQRAGLDRAGITVRVTDASMPDMVAQSLAGEADGVFGYYTSLTAGLRQNTPELEARMRFLRFNEVAPELSGSLVMASRAAVRDNPEGVRSALRAINRGLLATLGDPAAAVAAALKRSPDLDAKVEAARLADTIAHELLHPDVEQIGFGAFGPERLARAITLLADTQGHRRPSTASVFNPDFLPPLAERLSRAAIAPAQS
jgi:NitT/TauT family transport system substrate-binding protein